MNTVKLIVLSAVALLGWGEAQAAVTDTIQAPTGFFVPTDAQKYDAPYYRWFGDDWGWTHNAVAGAITSASLNISAFDVDAPSEVDKIYAWDSGSWVYLGDLQGASDVWAFSNFNLGASFFDDINAGLQVKIEIDTLTQGSWAVTLAKSSLSVDGGRLPPPNPIPEPETYALMLTGLIVTGMVARRRKQK